MALTADNARDEGGGRRFAVVILLHLASWRLVTRLPSLSGL